MWVVGAPPVRTRHVEDRLARPVGCGRRGCARNFRAVVAPDGRTITGPGDEGRIEWARAHMPVTEAAARALAPVLTALGIPPETVALLLVRPVSGSAALGVGAELIATYGPDSLIGRTAAVMLGSTETTFYTIAVYFGAAGIVKTRYAVPAALCADLAGFMAAAWAVRVIFY